MRPLKIKDRCTKKRLSKCKEMARLYDKIQIVYASVLEADKRIESIMCTILTDRAFILLRLKTPFSLIQDQRRSFGFMPEERCFCRLSPVFGLFMHMDKSGKLKI